ncbi:MAG: M20/M25/M40 family metallo-hydrolase [Pseudomonadota bacterium]
MSAAALMLAACGAPGSLQPEPVEPNPGALSEEALAERLAEAIRFETISRKGEPDASLGAFEGFRAWLTETYPRTFAALEVEDLGHGTLWLTLQGSDETLAPIVFIAHQDVVPVEPGTQSQWTHPPFEGRIADGYVWGRGAIDMKAHLVTLLTAMEGLLQDGFAPRRTVHIGLGHDEEVDGAGARAMAAWLIERDQRAWFVLDEGGAMVLDFPLTGEPTAMVAVAEKGFLTVEVTARARGGHSSSPPERTAVGLLAQALTRIQDNPFELSLEGGPVKDMLRAVSPDMDGMAGFAAARPGLFGSMIVDQMRQDDAARAMLGTTIAPTVISGGVVENVLPQEAHALINLRLHPRDSGKDALAHLRRAVDGLEGVTIEPYSSWSDAPPVAATSGPAWNIIAGAAASHAPEGALVTPGLLVATTDIRAFADAADNLYRYSPAEITLDDLARIHGDDERMAVTNLPVMVSYFRTVIYEAGMSEAR